MKRVIRLTAGFLFLLSLAVSQWSGTAGAAAPGLLISEVQTGGCVAGTTCTEDPKMEFVELYNPASSSVHFQNWKLQYLSASGATTTTLDTLNGIVSSHGFILLAYVDYYADIADLTFGSGSTRDTGMLAKTGGSLQVVNDSGTVSDLIGWGSAAKAETKAAKAAAPGQILQRSFDSSGSPIDTGNNASDFTLSSAATPMGGDFTADASPGTSGGSNGTTGTGESVGKTDLSCVGVLLNELLPNPKGSDAGHEFIELHNPTSTVVALDGCSLQSSANSKVFNLTGKLQPFAYRSFSDTESGLTLANAAGGTVWLLAGDNELDSAAYPPSMADNQAWALFSASWQATFAATPGSANVLLASQPCPAGQYRSDTTGRCRNTPLSPSSTASANCPAGKARNSATNRCKSASPNAESSLVPCKPGQERNPATNRCRKAADLLTGANTTTIHDVATPSSGASSGTSWIIAALAIVTAVAYGVYEWRQDIQLAIEKLKIRFLSKIPEAAAYHAKGRHGEK